MYPQEHEIALFDTRPTNFAPSFEVVACTVEHMRTKRILVLLRNLTKPYGGTWCHPAGKVEKGEDIFSAMQRELFEETGIRASRKLDHTSTNFSRFPGIDFVFHTFHLPVRDYPKVRLSSDEHILWEWATVEEIVAKPNLIPGLRTRLIAYQNDRHR